MAAKDKTRSQQNICEDCAECFALLQDGHAIVMDSREGPAFMELLERADDIFFLVKLGLKQTFLQKVPAL